MKPSNTIRAKMLEKSMDPRGLIDQLDSGCQTRARALIYCLTLAGFGQATVCGGLRSITEQYALYGLGRSEEALRKVGVPAHYARPAERQRTWCHPEDSDHVKGQAVDIDLSAYLSIPQNQLRAIAHALNVEWGGNWTVKDIGHFGLGKTFDGQARKEDEL